MHLYTFTDSAFSGGELAGRIGHGYSGGKNINQSLDTYDYFGFSVALDGNRLAVGAYGDRGSTNSESYVGKVYLYTFTDSALSGGSLDAEMGDGYTGGKNVNQSLDTSDDFGYGVSLDGNRLAVGAPFADGSGNSRGSSGEVHLYTFSNSTFSGGALAATIGHGYSGGKNINQTLGSSDRFGFAVSLSGNRLAVGARLDDGYNNSRSNSGAVYLYTFTHSVFS